MDYITRSDLETAFKSLDTMIQAISDEKKEAAIDSIIEYANGITDFYVYQAYPDGIETVPVILKKLTLDLAVYFVYQRIGTDKVPEKVFKDNEKAMEVLVKIADGDYKILGETTTTATVGAIGIDSDFERVF